MTEPGWALVILAGGLARRYGGPKQLDQLGPAGATLADYTLWDAWRAGATRAVFVIRPEAEPAFRAQFGRWATRLAMAYAPQRLDQLPEGVAVPAGRTRPWGTLHAVLAAESGVSGPFAVVNADDHYGPAALAAVGAFLAQVEPAAPELGVVGYRLRDTLSPAGLVSRALLVPGASGLVERVQEIHGLTEHGGRITGRANGCAAHFAGQELVSMNCWALTPAVFPLFRAAFDRFLSRHGGSVDAECLLPAAIGELAASGQARASVLAGGEGWFGVTHPADRPRAVAALSALVARGVYPTDLFATAGPT